MKTEMLVVMKNGHKFTVTVKDEQEWLNQMTKGVDPRATRNYFVSSPFLICLDEVAAIHPVVNRYEETKV